jgi:hypothetical protein
MRKVVTALREGANIYVDVMYFCTAPNGVEYLSAQYSHETSISYIDLWLKEHSLKTILSFKRELMRNGIAAIESKR